MGASLGGNGIMSEMNLTPLIDIVLVVLIIMMVNIPIQVEEMGVKLPAITDVPPPPPVGDPPEQLVVALYEDGRIALNREVISEEALLYQVSLRLRGMDKKDVFIDAHSAVTYGRVIDMVDLAREAGAFKVGFAKMKVEGPRTPISVHSGSMPRGVHIGSPTAIGSRTEMMADRAIQAASAQLESCFAQALGAKADQSGRVMLRVIVAPDGSLMTAENSEELARIASSNTGSDTLDECIRLVGERLQFPAVESDQTAIVQYPILFSPG